MHRANIFSSANIIQGLVDVVVLVLSYMISYFVAINYTNLYGMDHYIWILIVYIPVWLFILGNSRVYDKNVYFHYDKLLRMVLFSSFLSALLLASMMFFVKDTVFSRTCMLLS
jgi:FlaA1/EpsC-like NDP-sugar epimerase